MTARRRVGLGIGVLVVLGLGACEGGHSLSPVIGQTHVPTSAPSLPLRVSHPPQAPRASVEEGDRLRRAGHLEEALAAYRLAVAEHPLDVQAHIRTVALMVAMGRQSEARATYARRAARPGATTVEKTMAARLASDGSSSALRGVYAAAQRREPRNVWWRLATAEVEIAETEAWGRRAVDARKRGDTEAERAASRQVRAAMARADVAIEAAASLAPRRPEVDLYRGLLRAVEGDILTAEPAQAAAYLAAEDAYTRGVERAPDLVEAWEGLGDVRLRRDELRGSLLAFREAARLAPTDPELRLAVGGVLHRIGRFDDAAVQYHEAAVLSPRDGRPWLLLGDARAEAGRWDAALADYQEALRRDGSAIEAHFKRGAVFEHLERFGEAIESYERYVAQEGERSATARRRIERLLRSERAP